MAKRTIPAHPLLPQSLWERLVRLIPRNPTTQLPDWDVLKPEDLRAFDVEAEWQQLLPRITRLALDEAHGDVGDRLIEPRVLAYHQEVDRLLEEQREVLLSYRLQGGERLTRLSTRVAALRKDRAAHAERRAYAWEALCGTPPAAPEVPSRAVPIPTVVEPIRDAPRASVPAAQREPAASAEETDVDTYKAPTLLRPVPVKEEA